MENLILDRVPRRTRNVLDEIRFAKWAEGRSVPFNGPPCRSILSVHGSGLFLVKISVSVEGIDRSLRGEFYGNRAIVWHFHSRGPRGEGKLYRVVISIEIESIVSRSRLLFEQRSILLTILRIRLLGNWRKGKPFENETFWMYQKRRV